MNRTNRILLSAAASLFAMAAHATSEWSAAEYDLYPGDFNGDGRTDLLYVAISPDKQSGIALSDGTRPIGGHQAWTSGGFGIQWHSRAYVPVIGDFNWDGRADIFMHRQTPGDHYLLVANADGSFSGIMQTVPNSYAGLTWSGDQHRIISVVATVTGPPLQRGHRLFLQAANRGGTNALIATSSGGLIGGVFGSTWTDGQQGGFQWNLRQAIVHSGDFNGDGNGDLLVQAKPDIILVDYEIPIPVPRYRPQSFGIVLSPIGSGGNQMWDRKRAGVDWSASNSNLAIADFDGDGRDDVLVQPKRAGAATYLVRTNSATNQLLLDTPAAVTFSAAGSATGDSYRIVAANFDGGSTAGVYLQATSAGGSDLIAATLPSGGGTASTVAHAPSSQAPVTNAVGTLPGTADVSTTGAATYEIPLWVPPGINDMQPALSLSYSSSNGGGHFGPGWRLRGLSAITRCQSTWAQNNGVARDVRNDVGDRFCLDGNQLKHASGGYGLTGSEYRTEIETFSRIKMLTSAATGRIYFVEERKDGLKYEYGNTTSSEILSVGQSVARLWAVNRIIDRDGNAIVVSYNEDTTNGSFHVEHIDYTSNATALLPSHYRVTFVSESAPVGDLDTAYQANSVIKRVKRIDRINVTHDSTMVRYYELNYEPTLSSTRKSRLASIQACGENAQQCLPPTTFTYQNGTPGLAAEVVSSISLDVPIFPLSMDVNGDGRKDLVYSSSNVSGSGVWIVALANTTGGYSTAASTGVTNTNYSRAIIIDYNSDGMDDLLVPNPDGNWWVMLGNSGGLSSATTTNTPAAGTSAARAIDVNGDGRQDLVYSEQVGYAGGDVIKYRLRESSSFSTSPVALIDPLPVDSKLNDAFGPRYNAPDFDGDGRGDVMYRKTSRIWEPESQTYVSIRTYLYVICMGGATFATDTTSSAGPQFADFNGDGRTDLLYMVGGIGSSFRIRYSTGTSFTGEIAAPANLAYGFVLDWDADGRDDIFAPNTATGYMQYIRATGEGLAAGIDTDLPATTLGALISTDVNGDGLTDLAYWSGAGVWRVRLHSGVYPDLLTNVTDGFGMSTAFSYAPLTTASYTRESGGSSPNRDYQGPMYVVSTMTASTGIASPATYTKTFSYLGAQMNMQGRGFAGFREVRSTDSRNGLWEYSFFERAFPYIGSRYQQKILQPNQSTLIRQTDEHWSKHDDGNVPEVRSLPYVDQTTIAQYEVGGAYNGQQISTVTETVLVDAPTGTAYDTTTVSKEMPTGNGVQSNAEYTQRVYHPVASLVTDTPNWCLGMPGATQLINSHTQTGGGSITRNIVRTWDTSKCRPTGEVLESGGAWQVTTALTYDDAAGQTDPDVGHVTEVKVTGAGMSDRITKRSWGADGRFLRKVTNAVVEETEYDWDPKQGVPVKQTDANDLDTVWVYDSLGRRIRETRTDDTYTTWSFHRCTGSSCIGDQQLRWYLHSTEYGSTGSVINSADQYFDGAGRLRYGDSPTLTGARSRVASTYDSLGRLSQQSLPVLIGNPVYWQTFGYDVLNRVTGVTRPISASNPTTQTTSIAYKGLTTETTDALARVRKRVLNAWGLTARSIDDAGYYQSFSYDAFGNVSSVADSSGNTLQSIAYNVRGMKTSQTDMDLGTWTFLPNALGEVGFIRDAKTAPPAWTTRMTYDAVGRMTGRTDVPESVTSAFNFGSTPGSHNVGRLTSISGGGHTETLTYDSKARLSTRTIAADSNTYEIGYTYNSLGLLDVLTYPTSTSGYRLAVQYEYSNGFVSAAKDSQAPATVFWRASDSDALGNVTSERLGNGLQTSRTFDAVTGQLGSVQTLNGSGSSIQNLAYNWDLVGNLKQRRDLRQSLTEEFYYDNLHRLDCSTLNIPTQANCAALTTPQKNLDVDYDQLGNITSKSGLGAYAYHATKKHAVTSAGGIAYGYDANGNMNSRNGQTTTWYSYNLPNLINGGGGSSSQFYYTPQRERWKQVASYAGTSEQTTYIGGLVEKVALGGITSWRHYIAGQSGAVAVYTRKSSGTNETHYLTRDHLGSVDAVTDSAGIVEVRMAFGAFGERRNESGWSGNPTAGDWSEITDSTRRGFTFHETLDNLGLTHMNGRVYDQTIGRFLSADPFIPEPGLTQSFNRYSYVFNGPLSYTDPSGFDPDDGPWCRSFCGWLGFIYGDPRGQGPPGNAHGQPLLRYGVRTGDMTVPAPRTAGCDQVECGQGSARRSTVGGTNLGHTLTEAFVPGAAYFNLGYAAEAQGRYLAAFGWHTAGHLEVLGTVATAGIGGVVMGATRGATVAARATVAGAESAVNAAKLSKQLASQEGVAELLSTGGKVIAGPGMDVPVRDAARLVSQYGGMASDWVKVTSTAPGHLQTHAYRNLVTGEVVELKSIIP